MKKDVKDKNVDSGFTKEPNKDPKRIGIFLIATGNYICYFEQLLESIEKNFLKGYPKVYIISTDQTSYAQKIWMTKVKKNRDKSSNKNTYVKELCNLYVCLFVCSEKSRKF